MPTSNIKCNLADAANTYNIALSIIKAKGFKIFIYPDENEEDLGHFVALSNSRRFFASDPLRLLALVNIWENNGDDWRSSKNYRIEDQYNKILDRAFPDKVEDFQSMNKVDFEEMVADYKDFFKIMDFKTNIPEHPSPEVFFNIVNSFYIDENA